MIKILRNKDFNITDFLVDNIDGITQLANTNACAPGSTAYVVETGETYIKKNNGEWFVKLADKFGEPAAPKLTIEFFAQHIEGLGDEPILIKGSFGEISIPKWTTDTTYYADVEIPLTEDITFSPYQVGGFHLTIYVDDVEVDSIWDSYGDAPFVMLSNEKIEQYNITLDSKVRMDITQTATE